jgi:EAL domain-containing protein (putative c-di-GMP-specific phosphodiesterase class I)
LKNLSANAIKIDKSFVRDMLNDADDYAIINGVIGLANAFNLDLIAEGVETTGHGLMLLKMGCEQAQGYGIGRPMPAEDVPVWLIDYKVNNEWVAFSNKLTASTLVAV